MKKVLILFETSGAVSVPFKNKGFSVTTIDILPHQVDNTTHIQCDIFNIDALNLNYDDYFLLVAFFPCTYFSKAGLYLLNKQPGRKELQLKYLKLFDKLYKLPIKYKIFENPKGSALNKLYCKSSCEFNYKDYCDYFAKAELLWLQNLPPLLPTIYNIKNYGDFIQNLPYRKNGYNSRDFTPIEFGEAVVNQYYHLFKEYL